MNSLPLFSNMLDPEIDKIFSLLCTDVHMDLIQSLENAVDEHVEQIRTALTVNEFLDISTAEKIASTLKSLLSDIKIYPRNKQQLVVGAARYFVRSQDIHDDMRSLLGFDDDVAVLNFVLAELGHHEKRITL